MASFAVEPLFKSSGGGPGAMCAFAAGLLICAGLATRLTCAILAVWWLTFGRWSLSPIDDLNAIRWTSSGLSLGLLGPGAYSLDALWFGRHVRQRANRN